MVGKYVDLTESYKSLSEALIHAGIHTRSQGQHPLHRLRSRSSATASDACAGMDAILVPGGFGKRGVEGKIAAIRYARENDMPYLGICLGMQLAVIEYARNVAGLDGANSTEFDPDTPHPVVALITEWQDRDGRIEQRDATSDLGGTMRLGAQPCDGRARHARAPDLRRDDGRRAPSPSLRSQQPLPAAPRGRGPGRRRAGQERGRGRPVRDDRARRTIRGSSAASSTPSSRRTPRRGHPLFISFVRAALEHHAQVARRRDRDAAAELRERRS